MSRRVALPQRKQEALDKPAVRQAKPGARMFGPSLADVFSTPAYDCRAVGPDQKPEFAVTRLRSGPRDMEKAPVYPADQAILICVSLTPAAVGQWQACYNGKSVGVTRGGFKYSGVGREYGQYGIGAFLEPKAILE
jgi:hypothetical protein